MAIDSINSLIIRLLRKTVFSNIEVINLLKQFVAITSSWLIITKGKVKHRQSLNNSENQLFAHLWAFLSSVYLPAGKKKA